MTNMKTQLSVGVIGAGHMGRHHVRAYTELKGVKSVFVYDKDLSKAQSVADEYGAIFVDNIDDLSRNCEAVSIAAPTEHHANLGIYFLSRKIPCLIEKPLAQSEKECLELVQAAQQNNTILMVGHIEHFNPAFVELKRIIQQDVKIYSIDARRLSYASNRMGGNVDVIFDLMVHDIEIVLSLLGSEINFIHASNSPPDPGGHIVALMKDQNGVLITLTASRITQNKVRTLSITSDSGLFLLDFIRQELSLYHGGLTHNAMGTKEPSYKLDLAVEKLFVRNQEPLMAELRHFIEAIQKNEQPLVSAEKGLQVVRIAEKIKKSVETKWLI